MIKNSLPNILRIPLRDKQVIIEPLAKQQLPICPDADHYVSRLLESAASGAIFMVFDQYCQDHSIFVHVPYEFYQFPLEIARQHYVSLLPRDTYNTYYTWIHEHKLLSRIAVDVAIAITIFGWDKAFDNYVSDRCFDFTLTPFELLVNDLIHMKSFAQRIFVQSYS